MNLRDMPSIGLVNPEPPDYWYEEVECPDCEGTGLIPEELDGEIERTECSRCDGTGFLIWDSKNKRFI